MLSSQAEAEGPTIAVFTKNTTNPAYESFRIAVDQVARQSGAKTVHFVPTKPDDVDEQKAFVAQVLADKPDIVIFIPVVIDERSEITLRTIICMLLMTFLWGQGAPVAG